MKTITLTEAHHILENCSAVMIESNIVIYPGIADLTGEDENEFLYLSWEDEGLEYYVKFTEEPNKEVKIIGNSIFLIDHEGEEAEITPLFSKNLEDSQTII